MFLANHAAVGALLAAQTTNPFSAFILGYVSHYFIDMIPHGDEKVGTWIKKKNATSRAAGILLIDVGVMAVFFSTLSFRVDFPHPYTIAIGAFGAMLPDFLSGFYEYLRKFLNPNRKEHYKENGGWIIQTAKRFLWDNFFLERHFLIHRKIHFALGYYISFAKGMVLQVATLGFLYWSALKLFGT